MDANEDDNSPLNRLRAVRSNLTSLLRAAADTNRSLAGVDNGISRTLKTAAAATEAVSPIQSQAIAKKALHARINRAVSPALTVLQSFSLVESLQRRLLHLSNRRPDNSISRLLKFVDTVDQLHAAILSVTDGCDPAVQRLQDAVEFLSRTNATDELGIQRLRETLDALKVLYEAEVDAMSYEGLLDESLLQLQEEFEYHLQQIRHAGESPAGHIEVLRRIANTLASNDCLDICIDIFVKVRYRRAAREVMELKPGQMKIYVADIDAMEWPALESTIGEWVEHFDLAVTVVFAAEKRLCEGILGGVMDGAVWPECFTKIASKILAVFFQFGEEVSGSAKTPQKLFKLLDMLDTLDRMCDNFNNIFDGEPGEELCTRFRELQKLLVQCASRVFLELEVQIERDCAQPPANSSVPKIVRYAVNYLKCLVSGGYAAAMGRVLQTEKVWRAGFLSQPETEESLLRDAVSSMLDTVQRNVEAKRGRYKDKAAAHLFAMNAHWYMYMRARGTPMAVLVGEREMRRRYKAPAEEAAYGYQAAAWGPLVRILEREVEEGEGAVVRMKMEAFLLRFDEMVMRHRGGYCIPDSDLREQMREAVVKLVVPAYTGFLNSYRRVLQGRSFPATETIELSLGKLFDGRGEGVDGVKEGERSVVVKVDGQKLSDKRYGEEEGEQRSADGVSSWSGSSSGGGVERWRRVVHGMASKVSSR